MFLINVDDTMKENRKIGKPLSKLKNENQDEGSRIVDSF